MSDIEIIGPILDALRPYLEQMAAEILQSAIAQVPVLVPVPATVVSVDMANGVATVLPDGPAGGANISAQLLMGPVPVASRVMLLFSPPAGVFVAWPIGQAPWGAPNSVTARLVPGATRNITGVSGVVDWPPTDGPVQMTFLKRYGATTLQTRIEASGFVTVLAGAVDYYVDIDGVDYQVVNGFKNSLTDHTTWAATVDIDGITAGPHTIKVQAEAGTATSVLNADVNDTIALTVTEVL